MGGMGAGTPMMSLVTSHKYHSKSKNSNVWLKEDLEEAAKYMSNDKKTNVTRFNACDNVFFC